MKRIGKILLSIIFALSMINYQVDLVQANTEIEYLIYPIPQSINYQDGSFLLKEANIVYGNTIDQDTKNRLIETLNVKNISYNPSDDLVLNKLNILVSTYNETDKVNEYAAKYHVENSLWEKNDSYFLAIDNGVITVIGKDSDAAFYGLTTLYHIFTQVEDLSIRNLVIKDYAEVVTRGYIEGYYGNPWSVDDRIKLMEWGGYYKLNAYVYAPKDDPKHNAKWRELYTDEEIETIIKPLAAAGNRSKNRFLYALHPFMHNPLRFDVTNYQNDLQVIKNKLRQVIDAGVRQVSILADDARNFGGENYVRLMNDLTVWIKELKASTYPDLKVTMPFCVVEYMGLGESYFRNFGENIQLIMTGGRIWGTVNQNFTDTFKRNTGKPVFLWINWPCSDNSKNHLIMGGYKEFLNPNVNPENVEGIVLNPMQQSEPSKVAIFANAAYSWNIWENAQIAEKAWEDAFSFVDHNNAHKNAASEALKELSKHMINQNMDGRVIALQESVELKTKLNQFKTHLLNNQVTTSEIDSLIAEFNTLKNATETYLAQAGNQKTKQQIIYWLQTWTDITTASLDYLNAVKAKLTNNLNKMIELSNSGKTAFASSKKHGFHYVNHTEYAEVGVQHIVPFVKALDSYLNEAVAMELNPELVTKRYITSRTDNPVGSTDNIFDNDTATMASYRNPAEIRDQEYVGVVFNKLIPIHDLRILLGTGKNHFEFSKLQYTVDGTEWQDIPLRAINNEFNATLNQMQDVDISVDNLPENFEAMGFRLITTRANTRDAYLDVLEISYNKHLNDGEIKEIKGTYSTNREVMSGNLDLLKDNNDSTEAMISNRSGSYRDRLQVDSEVKLTFNEPTYLSAVYFSQGASNRNDVLTSGALEYLSNGTWTKIADIRNERVYQIDTSRANITAEAIRVRNLQDKAIWWRVGELRAITSNPDIAGITYNLIKTNGYNFYQGSDKLLHDDNDNSFAWFSVPGDRARVNDFVGYDLGKEAIITNLHIVLGKDNSADKYKRYAIEYSSDANTWTAIPGYEDHTGNQNTKDILDINLDNLSMRYIRVRNLEDRPNWIIFSEFTVTEAQTGDTQNLFTNLEDESLLVNASEKAKLSFVTNSVVLNNNDYIGFELDEVRMLESVNYPNDNSNIVIEYATHPLVFTPYTNPGVKAKYLRLRSTSDSNTVDLTNFNLTYFKVEALNITSNANKYDNNDVRSTRKFENLFDGDLSTEILISDTQHTSKSILIDLGQVIHFEQFRYYVNENSLDFYRSANFEVATDKNGPWTSILTIDSEFTNSSNFDKAKSYEALTHDSTNPGNMYAEASSLDVNGRYIKITPIKNYDHRWIRINELQINNGAYISPEDKYTLESAAVEAKDKLPSLGYDGNYTTIYKSSATDSNFIFHVTNPDMHTVRIIQLGENSNALVKAVILEDGRTSEIELGNLSDAINEYSLESTKQFVDVKVEWTDKIPSIAEIKLNSKAATTVNKDQLRAKASEAIDTSNWTDNSRSVYEQALAKANAILENNYVTQAKVDAALSGLNIAIDGARIKGDATDLRNELENPLSQYSEQIKIYSNNSFAAYNDVVNQANKLLEDANNLTQEEIDTIYNKLITAKNNLTYSNMEKELALAAIEELNLNVDDYTVNSFSGYQAKLNELNVLLAENTNPLEIHQKLEQLRVAAESLVSIVALKAKVDTVIDRDLYSESSLAAYDEKITEARSLYQDGEETAIAAMIDELDNILVLKDVTDLEVLITNATNLNSADYTNESYTKLQTVLAEVNEEKTDETKASELLAKLNQAIDALVNVTALNNLENQLTALNLDSLTTDSKTQVQGLIDQIAQLKENGSTVNINQFLTDNNNYSRNLETNALTKADELTTVALIENDNFTTDSYQAYLNAYNEYKNQDLRANSLTRYQELKELLDSKQANLVKNLEYRDSSLSNLEVLNKEEFSGMILSMNELLSSRVIDLAVAEKDVKAEDAIIFDINLYNSLGVKVQPSTPMQIKFDIPNHLLSKKDQIVLIHIHDNLVEEIAHQIEGNKIVFNATKFSYYLLMLREKVKVLDNNDNVVANENNKVNTTTIPTINTDISDVNRVVIKTSDKVSVTSEKSKIPTSIKGFVAKDVVSKQVKAKAIVASFNYSYLIIAGLFGLVILLAMAFILNKKSSK